MLKNNLKILICVVFLVTSNFLSALDFSLRPAGFALFPSGKGNTAGGGLLRYGIGGGANLGFEADLASVWPNPLGLGYTVGIEGLFLYNSLKSYLDSTLQMYSFGGDLGLYFFPASRLMTRINGAVGVCQGIYNNMNSPSAAANKNNSGVINGHPGLWWSGGGELGFRFTPAFILSADGGWRQFNTGTNSNNTLISGIYAGVTAQINFETGASIRTGGIDLRFTQEEAVYPVFLQIYQHYGAGNITIRNNENAEIRNVQVSFRAGNYTASEYPCGSAVIIPRGRWIDVPLYADFSPELLKFSDSGRINGELIVRYSFLGKEKTVIRSLVVAVNSRNALPGVVVTDNTPDFSGVDWSSLAAFVSPTSVEVLNLSKNITGLARTKMHTAINPNLHFGIWLFEGLGSFGFTIANNPVSGVQYPAQTLVFKTGTALDMALLYASVLEAGGIPAAILPITEQGGNDFIAAISLGISRNAAEASFNGLDKLLVIGDKVWLPLSMKNLNMGFSTAWSEGVKALNTIFANNGTIDFIPIEDAWTSYPPAPFESLNVKITPPPANTTYDRAERAIQAYISGEIIPQITKVTNQIQKSPTAALYNQLGLLNVRAGRIADAKAAYERAAGMNNVSGMINRGNIALTENDYTGAAKWFSQALSVQPGNETASQGLAQAEANRGR